MPFGPVVQALRDVHRRLDPDDPGAGGRRRATGARPSAPRARRGDAPTTSTTAPPCSNTCSARCSASATVVPTLLVLEDLHWADHSTRDFLVFLARNLRDARVLVVGTFRTDDLHRRHPLRPVLAELDRSGAAHRLDLARFDRDEIAELIAAIRGEAATARARRLDVRTLGRQRVLRRRAARGRGGVRGHRCPSRCATSCSRASTRSRTPRSARCRVVAVIGRTADSPTGRARSPRSPRPSSPRACATRSRTRCSSPSPTPSRTGSATRSCTRRVRRPVAERARPSARPDRRAARSTRPDWFDGDEQSLASELACHWDAAHDQRRALPGRARRRACGRRRCTLPRGARARRTRADAVGARRRTPPALTGLSHAAMLRFTADAGRHGRQRRPRARRSRGAALEEVDPETDPIEAALVHERIGRYMWYENYAPDDVLEHNREAVRLVPEMPPTIERAQVLATLGQQLMIAGRERRGDRDVRGVPSRSRVRSAPVSSRATRTTRSAARSSGLGQPRGRPGRARDRTRHRARDRVVGRPRPRRRERERQRAGVQPATRKRSSIALEGAEDRPASRSRPRVRRVPAHQRRRRRCTSSAAGTRWRSSSARPTRSRAPASTCCAAAHAWATLFAGRGQFDAAAAQIERGRSLLRGIDECRGAARVRDGRSPSTRVVGRSRAARSCSLSRRSRRQVWASSCSDAGPALLADRGRRRPKIAERDRAPSFAHARPLGRRSPMGWRRTGRRAVGPRRSSKPNSTATTPTSGAPSPTAWEGGARIPNATYARFRVGGRAPRGRGSRRRRRSRA